MALEHRPSGSQNGVLRARFSLLSFVQKVAVATVAAVLSAAIIAVLGIQAFSSGSKTTAPQARRDPTSATGGSVTNTSTPPAAQNPVSPPAAPKYLSELAYTEGDRPGRGTVELWEHAYARSVYWEEEVWANSEQDSCSSWWECRAITYNLKGKYRHLTALVGGTTKKGANETYPGYWWVVADGVTAKGKFMLNRPPVPISVPVSGFHAIELRISTETNGKSPVLAFAEAHVS
jgi:hypothetical protein